MPSTIIVGGFFGDEGKGKIISYLALKDNPKVVVRGGAGPNAGHTIKDGEKVYKVRMLPSGFLNKDARVMIGPGVVINPEVLEKEKAILKKFTNFTKVTKSGLCLSINTNIVLKNA